MVWSAIGQTQGPEGNGGKGRKYLDVDDVRVHIRLHPNLEAHTHRLGLWRPQGCVRRPSPIDVIVRCAIQLHPFGRRPFAWVGEERCHRDCMLTFSLTHSTSLSWSRGRMKEVKSKLTLEREKLGPFEGATKFSLTGGPRGLHPCAGLHTRQTGVSWRVSSPGGDPAGPRQISELVRCEKPSSLGRLSFPPSCSSFGASELGKLAVSARQAFSH
jgi:hypothetical protein